MLAIVNNVKKVENNIYVSVIDLTTIHFEEPEKPLVYPMIWSMVKKYAKDDVKKKLDIAIETWFMKQSKTV